MRDRSRFPAALVTSVGLVVVAVMVLVVSLTLVEPTREAAPEVPPDVTDSRPEPPRPVPEPEPEPEPPPPPPPPEPEPVVGTVEVVEIVDLSVTGSGLFREGATDDAAVPVDEDAVAAFAEKIGVWFDTHLTDLQLGGAGTIGELTGSSFEPLAGPDHLITDVAYTLQVGARGAPEWAEVTVTVTREHATVTTVLAVAPGDEPSLIAASAPEALDGTEPPRVAAAGGGER